MSLRKYIQASGHGAYLLEESKETPELFTVSIGNLPPKKEVLIEVTYVSELQFKDNQVRMKKWFVWHLQLRFSIPSVKGAEIKDSSYYRATSSSPPVSNSLKATLNMQSNIKAISSPSHPIRNVVTFHSNFLEFEFGDSMNRANVTLSNSQSEKDFELLVKLAEPHKYNSDTFI